jgi:pantothenate kinase-related protein Tda10
VPVTNPIDVFILEGWSMGFQPIGATELTRRYNDALSSHASPRPVFLDHSLESLIQVDSYLSTAAQTLYPPFQVLIQIRPESYDYVYEWREEQEHAMIARRGAGMTDEQVEAFVRRYMPGYELWSDVGDAWRGRSLVLWFGRGRDVVKTERL